MPTTFFQIGTTDLTEFVDIQTYKINREDVYETWTDGNWMEHRVVARTRISGTLRLGFADAADLAAFLALLAAEKTAGGWYPVTAYVLNTGATAAVDAFVDPEGEAKWDIKNGRQWVVQTLSVRQR